MVEAIIQGFASVLSFSVLPLMLIGVILGLLIGAIPGLGGAFALAVLVPFVYNMEPAQAFAFLLGAHAVIYTGGSITAILLNTPGSGPNAATLFDGFPMAQQGQAGRALGNALAASAVGGVFGAIALALLIPVIRPVVLAFGPPEFFMMAILGISFIALMGEGSLAKGLIAGGLGIIISLVGYDPMTGIIRYNFGSLYLYDGIKLVPLTLGLFAVAEMIHLAMKGGTIAQSTINSSTSGVLEGIKDVFRHWWLVMRCGSLGTLIGAIPGLGGDVACFLAYGHARQTSRQPEKFGKGHFEGVIAPESANNAKEGGGLLPTLGFGIPGSSSMAILLGAFLIIGVKPGPEMLGTNLNLVFVMVATLVFANIIGAIIGLLSAGTLARITNVRASLLVPSVLVLTCIGAFAVESSMGDVVATFILGIVGYVMKIKHYPRAVLLIGFVLGKIAELNLHLSIQIFGPDFFLRPIALVLLIITIITLFSNQIAGFVRARREVKL